MAKLQLYMTNAGLKNFPSAILTDHPDLELLDLSGNQLEALPDEIAGLRKLRILFLTANRFREIPEILAHCPALQLVSFKSNGLRRISEHALPTNLRWLILTDNCLQYLPASFGELKQLQKLALSGNQLLELPQEMRHCSGLELLRIASNGLPKFPIWLLELPRLAWLGYAANPFCASLPVLNQFPPIPNEKVTIQEQLAKGLGGSGLIFKGQQECGLGTPQQVAIKAFKGGMLADGSPLDEMSAWLAAGVHPNLVRLRGPLVGHASHTSALVFDLIQNDYRNLAFPPNFDSCTRDVYREEDRFSEEFSLNVLHGIAKVAQHLHERALLHGDLYAHNILVNRIGVPLLGDLGAASPIPISSPEIARGLESIEIRAFGYLVQEILAHSSFSQSASEHLQTLEKACLSEVPSLRPKFSTIIQTLNSLTDSYP